jgi:hypothetical protein
VTRDPLKTATAVRVGTLGIFADPDGASLKRIAWAFGCAKKGSDEEIALFRILRERFERLETERDALEPAVSA